MKRQLSPRASPLRALHIVRLRLQRRLGWAGLGGAALLLAAAAAALALPGLQADTETLAQRLKRAQSDTQALVQQRSASPDSAQSGRAPRTLAEFGAQLPALRDNAADMGTLLRLAETHKLALAKGDYQLSSDPRAPVQSYSVTLPLHGSYATLKKFSAEALRALPHAVLDELRMERLDAASTDVDARVRFTLLYKGE